MALTSAQLAALKADILADATLNAFPNNSDGAFEIAKAYNLTASPDYWIWRTSVPKSELVNVVSTDADGTTTRSFIWAGNGFITRSAGEQTAWRELFNGTDSVNASLPNVRQAFTDIFSGTGNAASNRTHLSNVARKKATRAQKLFSSGAGTAASPATTNEGISQDFVLSFQDVQQARELP
jgi:hypothetical protein